MNSVQKQAMRDAEAYARAYMSYGEGAGNARKLIYGTVDYKMATVPGYREAFQAASTKQDMAKMAKEAERTNRRRSINTALTRNTRAIATGRYQDVNSLLLVAGGTAYFAHRYGLDKKAYSFGKKKVAEGKALLNRLRKNNVHNIRSVD